MQSFLRYFLSIFFFFWKNDIYNNNMLFYDLDSS